MSAVGVTIGGILPVFLTGALAPQMTAELGFGTPGLGGAVAAYFAASTVGSAALGRVADRIGWQTGLRLAGFIAALASLAIALGATSWATLVAALAVAGLANALGQPAANLGLAEGVTDRFQGLTFGIKQASIPAAVLLGGLAVPGIALTVGWRWAFVAAGALASAAAISVPPGTAIPVLPRSADGESFPAASSLLLLAAAGGLGAAAGNSLGSFLVASSVELGVTPGTAGVLLAVGSGVGLAVRIGAGWWVGSRPRAGFVLVATLALSGTGGFALLATETPTLLLPGSLLAFGAGWGWPGVFYYAVVRASRSAPATATGIVQTGTYLGASGGPAIFGVVAERWSFSSAWWVAAIWLVLTAAAVVVVGSRGRDER